MRKKLKLLTYNIHSGKGRDRRYDLERIASILKAESPHIVALQEVNRGMSLTKRDDQPRVLADMLGMNEYFCRTSLRAGGEWGIALLSPFTLVHRHEFDLSYSPRRQARFCLRVDIEVAPNAMLHVFNCHLGLTSRERLFQRKQMLSEAVLLSEDLRHPVILMGDFNDRPLSVVHRHLRNHFEDAFYLTGKRSEPTFKLGPIRFKLDHIYLSRGINILDCWVKKDGGADVASDHLPLVSLIEVDWPTPKLR